MRIAGDVPDAVVDAIWKSRHRVLTVVRRAAVSDDEGVRAR
jgi:hypothetical protein